jgi:peptidoglycan/LPS O-acetylase OafA/YrhL
VARDRPWRILERLFVIVPVVVFGLRLATNALLPFQHHTHHWPTHLRIDSLLFGVWLAYVAHEKPSLFKKLVQWRTPLLCVGMLCLLPPMFRDASDPFIHTAGYTLLYIGYGTVLIFALGSSPSRFAWARAAGRSVAAVGAYSYSIYLWHAPFEGWVMPSLIRAIHAPFLVMVVIYVTGSCLIGIGMARLIEFPVLRLRDRLFPSRTAPIVAALPRLAS